MAIRAENNPRFSLRFWFMGIVAIGFAFYCMYDGLVGYPARRVKGFEEFKTDYKSLFSEPNSQAVSVEEFEAQADKERRHTWDHYSHDRDIPAYADVITQFVMAAITGMAGLWFLSIPLRARGRWIELDESGLRSSWGQSFGFDQIELINKRKWRDKGLATIVYRDGNRKRKFIVDDLKFMRDPTDAILFEIEQQVGIGKITGGPPETLASDELQDEEEVHEASEHEPS